MFGPVNPYSHRRFPYLRQYGGNLDFREGEPANNILGRDKYDTIYALNLLGYKGGMDRRWSDYMQDNNIQTTNRNFGYIANVPDEAIAHLAAKYAAESPVPNEHRYTVDMNLRDMGYRTRGISHKKALETFQSRNGVPVTGKMDSNTTKALDREYKLWYYNETHPVSEFERMQRRGKEVYGIDTYQHGGPLYVTDPNHPRLQPYQDSLSAYKFGEEDYKFGKGIYDLVRSDINRDFQNTHTFREVPYNGSTYTDSGLVPIESYSEAFDRKPLSLAQRLMGKSQMDYYVDTDGKRWIDNGTLWNRFKKPEQEVILLNMEDYPNVPPGQGEYRRQISKMPPPRPKRDKESVDRLPSSSTPQLESTRTITAKRAPNPLHEEGEHIIPWENIPNLSVVMRRNKGSQDYTPYAIENTMGKRILYKNYRDGKLPKGFQHPEGMRLGGVPHFPHGGPHSPRDGGTGIDIPDVYYGPRDPTSGGATVSPDRDGFDYTGAFKTDWSNAMMPFLGGQFAQLFEGQQGYKDFMSRQGQNSPGMAQPGFFGFQRGGMVNDRARRGYSDGSPYRGSPSINIPGNNVTMANTSMPLMLVPNQGRPTMAPPRSGSYYFPGASNVQEIPMRQFGGASGMAQFLNNPEAMAQATAYSQKVDKSVLRPKGDPWEYRQTDAGYQTRKKGSDKWITVTEKTNNGAALANIEALYTGKPMPYRVTASGKAILNTPAKAAEATQSVQPQYNMTGQGMFGNSPQVSAPRPIANSNTPVGPVSNIARPIGDQPPTFISPADIQGSGFGANDRPGGNFWTDPMVRAIIGYGSALPALGMTSLTAPLGIGSGIAAIPPMVLPSNFMAMAGELSKLKKYQMGGEVQDNEPIEVQTEKGEVIAFQDGALVPVKAKKSHKKMDKDEVTDVLPKGTYIFSKDKKMIFRPDQKIGGIVLEDLVIGKSVVQYSEIEPSPAPEEITLGRILTKKMTPADMANKVRIMFPVTDREKDPFARWSNEENKDSRLPYLEALVAISETKRPKRVEKFQYGGLTKLYDDRTLYGMAGMDNVMKRDNQLLKSTMLPSNIMSTSHSLGLGKSKFFPRTFPYGGVPKFQDPLTAAFNPLALIGTAVDLGFGIYDRIKGNKYFKDSQRDIDTNRDTTRGYLGQSRNSGYGGNFLNYALQDTGYDELDLNPLVSSTDNTYGQVLRGIQADKQSSQQLPLGQANSFMRYASGSGMTPTQIGNYAGQIGAQGIGQSNAANLQYNQMYGNTLLGQGATTRGYQGDMAVDRQMGRNYRRGANNQINANFVQGMTGTHEKYLQGMADLDMQTVGAKMAARGQQMNFMTNTGLRIGDAATNLGQGIYNAVRPPYDPYGTDSRYGRGHQGGYSTPNWGAQVPYSGGMMSSDPNYFGSPYGAPPGYTRPNYDPWSYPG